MHISCYGYLLCYIKCMQPVHLYKKLPQTNCGKCSASTCMAFAVQYLRQMIPLNECPELDEAARSELESMVSGDGDWKERRLQEMFREMSETDFSKIAEQLGAREEEGVLRIRYMGNEVFLSHADVKGAVDIMDRLLIVMYVKRAASLPVTGKWVAFRELKDGIVRSESFQGACEMALARMFEQGGDGFLHKLKVLGAEEVTGYPAPHSLLVYPLPKIPFLVLLWPADEEFGADCKVLLDATAADYLDVETLLYLGIGLVRAVGSMK